MPDHDETAQLAALAASVPAEIDLWRAGVLDADLLDLLCRTPTPAGLPDLPAGVVPAVLLGACLDAGRYPPHERALLLDIACRHRALLGPALILRRGGRALAPLDRATWPHPLATKVLWLDAGPQPGWLLAEIDGPAGFLTLTRRVEDPWLPTARRTLATLRAALPQ